MMYEVKKTLKERKLDKSDQGVNLKNTSNLLLSMAIFKHDDILLLKSLVLYLPYLTSENNIQFELHYLFRNH